MFGGCTAVLDLKWQLKEKSTWIARLGKSEALSMSNRDGEMGVARRTLLAKLEASM